MSTTDPLDILLTPTNPQSTAVDLTNHPVVLAAIEASYQQEAEIAAAKVIVGIISRALEMVPVWGPALGNVLTGAGDQNAIVAQIQNQLASDAGASVSSPTSVASILKSTAIKSAVSALAGNPAVATLMAALQR